MRTVEVEIQGVTSLLIHRFGESEQTEQPTRHVRANTAAPREEALRNAYIAPNGTFYFSAFAIPNAMAAAGANHKQRGSRKTLRFVVPSAVRLMTDTITINNGHGGPAQHFEVDGRPVTIPATRGRIMRYRPRFDGWSALFDLQIDDKLLSLDDAHMLLNEAGEHIGIGDFRPEKRGPFGTFRVTRWSEAPQ